MLQKTYHITDFTTDQFDHMLAEVAALPAYRSAAQTLVFVFEMNWDSRRIHNKLDAVKRALPGADIVGTTHYEDTFQGVMDGNHTIFSFLFFENRAFTLSRIPLAGRNEAEIAGQFSASLKGIDALRGVMILFSGLDHNLDAMLEQCGVDSIPVFGTSAGVSDTLSYSGHSYVFDGEGCYEDMLLAVAFHGEQLHLEVSPNFGWQSVGRIMTVTAMDGDFRVKEIDHQPAAEIYRRYLGLHYKQNTLAIINICEFPFLVERPGMGIVRIPSSWEDDGTLVFHAPLRVGDRLRLCYGLPQQIFERICEDSDHFGRFAPQAMLLIICMNRLIFLKDREKLEIDSYRRVAPELAYVHGNSELIWQNGVGGEQHSLLIAMGLREGDAAPAHIPAKSACLLQETGDAIVPLELRLMTFMRAVTADLEETTRELIHLQHNLEDEVARKSRENESLSLHVVMSLADAIDAKDTYTNGHSGRVAKYAREIARRAGMSALEQNEIFIMGLLHDVGKIGVPDAVINKPGRLTDEEFAMIKTHPAMGARILGNIKEMPGLATGAHWHHERIDGRGYPDGLKGEQIPIPARIIGVADAYDAMTSNRSYRGSMPQSVVREQLEKGKGTQFDPVYADIMIGMIDEDKDYRMREIPATDETQHD